MSTQNPPVKIPLWRRLVRWLLRTAVVLIVLGIAAYAIAGYWAARAIHNEIARVRARGEPLTFAQLDALTPRVDRAQDAGPYYTAAAELVNPDVKKKQADDDIVLSRKPSSISPEILARARQIVEQNRMALDLLDRGSALPGCNSDIQLDYGFDISFPHISKTRALLDVASLRSRVLAIDGQGEQAIESVISSLGLLRTMDRQPVLIDALVQSAMLDRACDDAGFVLEKWHPTAGAIDKLEEALRRVTLIPPRRIFVAERVSFLEITRNNIADGREFVAAGVPTPPLPERLPSNIVTRVMTARTLPTYSRYVDAASGTWPGILSAVQNVADSPTSMWDRITGPAMAHSMVTYARALSVYRCTLIALQIEGFRSAHAGELPASLRELADSGNLPPDPFTGNALVYLKVPDGYCVFSAGRGRADDGKLDRAKDPVTWAEHWGVHIRSSDTPAHTASVPGR